MELKNLLVIFYLFAFLYLCVFFILVYFGVILIDYSCFMVEFFFPFSYLIDLSLGFCFDYVSVFFFCAVSIISRMVFLYRKYYIDISYGFQSDNNRFLYLLFLFVLSMFFLVFSCSWVTIMLG